MTEEKLRTAVAALLHDVGKVVYRVGASQERHPLSGAKYLDEKVGLQDEDILAAVKCHHAAELKKAKLADTALAYVVYMADNIASAVERRDAEETDEQGFDKKTPLASLFNLLNDSQAKGAYSARLTNVEEAINFPTEEAPPFEAADYGKILTRLTDTIKGLTWTADYVHSLLEVLEATLLFVPSSTNRREVADVSLYDHAKLTAAVALAMIDYLAAEGANDYREKLFLKGQDFYDEKVFLLTVLDISGIQKFIYTVASDGALKNLRARSFYLDLLMEHVADELLDKLGLLRTNLLYCGGGRADFILPNTEATRGSLAAFQQKINEWLREHFDIALYLSIGYAPCSKNNLQNSPPTSYAELYRARAEGLAYNKSHRYTAEEILALNAQKKADHARECKVCRSVGKTNEEELCTLCAALKVLAGKIMRDDLSFFGVVKEAEEADLPLPGGYFLKVGTEKEARAWQRDKLIRLYGKNRFYAGKQVATKLWIGDYHTGETFEELAKEAQGIPRLGVFRADVDNLGSAFALGFRHSKGADKDKYVTLSRTAGLSRQLSLFFKLHIKKILAQPRFTLTGKPKEYRHAAIVYSGGDDLFLVGAWDDILEFAVDLRKALAAFTENTLTLSAGIGIYEDSYPVSVMAEETALLEESSKSYPGKNAVTLPGDGYTHTVKGEDGQDIVISDNTYSWERLEKGVLGEKFALLYDFFETAENERGKNFLYNLLKLIRERRERINLARFVYLLSRLEPKEGNSKTQYREFSAKMLHWMESDEDARELKTAILIYAYITRKREG
ncbi:MAG: type III-A CRISPR-associated protein Cas10/Csm1 [Selenomonadaceae bacterium]|nr:type III-A CRISPR-associated protein Cas10/Csm1 [Selenomonadaceae bacterium]